jgi:hypothetical protein
MASTYEAPTVVELGDFHQDTGEWTGPHDERWLPWRDYSKE